MTNLTDIIGSSSKNFHLIRKISVGRFSNKEVYYSIALNDGYFNNLHIYLDNGTWHKYSSRNKWLTGELTTKDKQILKRILIKAKLMGLLVDNSL